jgi:hypothetical protein
MGRPRNPELLLDPGESSVVEIVLESLGEMTMLNILFVNFYISMKTFGG